MKHLPIAIALFAISVTGCASTSQTAAKSEEPMKSAAPAEPALSAEAKMALGQAEAAVKNAKANFALWMPTESALKMAQEAAKAGDSEAVIKQAKVVTEQVKASLAQTSYPSTEMQ